jgi:hypothetical protein
MRGKWLLLIGAILVLLYFTFHERERCLDPSDVWVMSEKGWVCVRPTLVR